VGVGTTSPGATLQVNGTVKMFGAWDDTRDFDTIYGPASTDGFVVAVAVIDTNEDKQFRSFLHGYTDENDPPTTLRGVVSCLRKFSKAYTWDNGGSMTMPVKKGDYWMVTEDNQGYTSAKCYLYWIPLGN
jgi:hypothetical protein